MIAKGLLLKGGAGLATAAAGGTGIYYGLDHFKNQLTEFDRGLVNFLKDKGKIKFAVTNGTSKLSTFPSTFTNGSEKIIVVLKIADSTTEDTEGKITDVGEAKKENLKKLNGDNDWTWKCEINLNRNSDSSSASDVKDKGQIFKGSGSDGVLDKLKGEGEEKLKIKFIENCGKERGKDKNREINKAGSLSSEIGDVVKPANTLLSSKNFQLRKGIDNKKERGSGSSNESTSKLYFDSEADFDTWFTVQK